MNPDASLKLDQPMGPAFQSFEKYSFFFLVMQFYCYAWSVSTKFVPIMTPKNGSLNYVPETNNPQEQEQHRKDSRTRGCQALGRTPGA